MEYLAFNIFQASQVYELALNLGGKRVASLPIESLFSGSDYKDGKRRAMVTRPLLNYYGGKWTSAKWIISNFPEHELYVEVFGGAASVLLLKPRSNREVVNDIDSEIVNVYEAVRDHGRELSSKLLLTPFSRAEYALARIPAKDKLEAARRTVVKSFMGIGDSISNENGFRNSKTSTTCPAKQWVNWHSALDAIIGRFNGVMIECRNWKDILRIYDSPSTFFYLDPPYVHSSRNSRHTYTYEFTDADHEELIESIQKLSGRCIISGYEDPTYSSLEWVKVKKDFKTQGAGFKTECLWLCPKTVASEKQMDMGLR